MRYFTTDEFKNKYAEYMELDIPTWKIEAVCEMIFSQIGLRYRDTSWNSTSVPLPIKNAAMEQMRFMFEHDIPFVDIDKHIQAGNMSADLSSDYSTLALRILANNGYLFRGVPMNYNMGIDIPFGD